VIRLPMGNRAHRANLLLIARPDGPRSAAAAKTRRKRRPRWAARSRAAPG
jgi:hypothetical protein